VNEVSVDPHRIGMLLEKEWTLGVDKVKKHNIMFVDKDFDKNT